MATGIVGVLSGATTLTYTPATNAKVQIAVGNLAANSTITINGAPFSVSNGTYAFGVAQVGPIFVGAGQTLTITGSSSVSAIVSTLES